MDLYENQLELFSKAEETSLTFIVGDKGLGKSFFIHSYYKNFENILYIKDEIFKSYFLEPIITALTKFDSSCKIEFDELNMPQTIRKMLLDICRQKNIIICFESFNSYPEDLAEFCISFLQSYLDCDNIGSFILIELDSDIKDMKDTLLHKLYSLTINTNFIKFKKKTEEELFDIISSKFNNKINIGEEERKYIIKSSFGNIKHLFLIINYLKQEGYIHFDGIKWICEQLPNGILNQSIEEYIMHRYNMLNEDLKILLQKSSLLGTEFYSNQLQKTFNLVRVDEELSRIEKLSSLIQKNDNYDKSKYLFETEDVCNNIQNLIPENEKKVWNKMLAEYYEMQFRKHDQNMIKRLENCCRLATYYINSDNLKMAIIFYYRSIRYSIYLLDYKGALELITLILKIPDIRNSNVTLYFESLKLQAYCYHQLGKYELSTDLYFKLLKNNFFTELEMIEIFYFYADSLYFIGKVSKAQEILLTLKEDLKYSNNNKLLFRVLSELATTYGFLREYGSAREYFSYSVNQSRSAGLEDEYYIQLRKSSMFWELKLTFPLMEQAAEYFERKNNIQELAKTYHNLGTDLLYLGDSKAAINYLRQAITELQKYGSDEIHYTYNCIGVYYATYEKKFEKAIEYFKRAISFKPVLFSTMVLYLNMSSCYKALQNNENAEKYLEKAMHIQTELGKEVPSYSLYLLINQGLYAKLDGRLKESEKYFKESLRYKLTNNQLYLVGKNLSQVSRNLDKDTLKYVSIDAEPLYKRFFENNICLSTLRFWE
jgi:hypothetical protein